MACVVLHSSSLPAAACCLLRHASFCTPRARLLLGLGADAVEGLQAGAAAQVVKAMGSYSLQALRRFVHASPCKPMQPCFAPPPCLPCHPSYHLAICPAVVALLQRRGNGSAPNTSQLRVETQQHWSHNRHAVAVCYAGSAGVGGAHYAAPLGAACSLHRRRSSTLQCDCCWASPGSRTAAGRRSSRSRRRACQRG